MSDTKRAGAGERRAAVDCGYNPVRARCFRREEALILSPVFRPERSNERSAYRFLPSAVARLAADAVHAQRLYDYLIHYSNGERFFTYTDHDSIIASGRRAAPKEIDLWISPGPDAELARMTLDKREAIEAFSDFAGS